jgi:ubiquitin carboxyl-terminal hydrolase 36/42
VGHKGECAILSQAVAAEYIDAPDDTDVPTLPLEKYLFPPKRITQMMSFEGPEHRQVGGGLVNVGNSCYVNSVLQCLTHCRPLVTLFTTGVHRKTCTVHHCAYCLLEEHISTVFGYQYCTPRELLLALPKINRDFVLGQQEDAHEFFISLLQKTQEVLVLGIKPLTPELEATTVLHQLFGGLIQSQVQCLRCQKTSTRYEPFLDLSLEVASGNSVEEALTAYTSVEKLEEEVGWRCERCAKASAARKQLTIRRPPNLLTIHLKRFDIMRDGLKLNKPVVFRERIDMRRFLSRSQQNQEANYELYGVVVHYGAHSRVGHYVSFVKVANAWIAFDDKTPSSVTASVVLQHNAYLLFYRQLPASSSSSSSSVPSPVAATPATSSPLSALLTAAPRADFSAKEKSVQSVVEAPPFRLYLHSTATDADASEMVLRVELMPLPSGLKVQVAGDGTMCILSETRELLRLSMPLSFQPQKCRATFYAAAGLLYVFLPMGEEATTTSTSAMLDVAISTESSLLPPHLNSEAEVEITSRPSAASNDSQQKPSAEPRRKQDSNEEVPTYSKLVKTLNKLNTSSDGTPAPAPIPSALPPAASASKKVGRNDPCPCGSERKYKACHGK